jgi:hypothetical protein
LKFFGATNTINFSCSQLEKFCRYHKILVFPIGKLELPTYQQSFFLFLHAGNPFSRPGGNPFASPRGNWECSHLLPPLPKTLYGGMHSHSMLRPFLK